jgi:DNA-binding MarR family transcriptional regulator
VGPMIAPRTEGRPAEAVTGAPNRELLDEAVRFAKALLRWSEAPGGGMPYPRMRVLELLADDGPSRMTDLGEKAGLRPRNLTSVADALEAEGMVVRSPHPADRRATLLGITPRGTAEIDRALGPRFASLAEVFDVLDPDGRTHLVSSLRQLSSAIEERQGPV